MTEEEAIQEQAEESKNGQYLAVVIFGLPIVFAFAVGIAKLVKCL